jgi:hypothetical protein
MVILPSIYVTELARAGIQYTKRVVIEKAMYI